MSELRLINPPGTEAIYKSFRFSEAVVAGGTNFSPRSTNYFHLGS